jgi:hypothetical protein
MWYGLCIVNNVITDYSASQMWVVRTHLGVFVELDSTVRNTEPANAERRVR